MLDESLMNCKSNSGKKIDWDRSDEPLLRSTIRGLFCFISRDPARPFQEVIESSGLFLGRETSGKIGRKIKANKSNVC